MKIVAAFSILLIFAACSTKKAETSSTSVDSLAADSVIATTPAQASLAYGALDSFSASKALKLPDSTNYFLLGSEDVLNQSFTRDKNAEATIVPDFIINYVIGVVCAPDRRNTTITMDKVTTGESSIDVFLSITRGAAGKVPTRQAQLFAIERREGYPVMQFYVNGKKDKALVLVENP